MRKRRGKGVLVLDLPWAELGSTANDASEGEGPQRWMLSHDDAICAVGGVSTRGVGVRVPAEVPCPPLLCLQSRGHCGPPSSGCTSEYPVTGRFAAGPLCCEFPAGARHGVFSTSQPRVCCRAGFFAGKHRARLPPRTLVGYTFCYHPQNCNTPPPLSSSPYPPRSVKVAAQRREGADTRIWPQKGSEGQVATSSQWNVLFVEPNAD